MKFGKIVDSLIVGALLLVMAGVANAQAQPWDTNIITYNAPTTCSTGESITQCPVTGYRLERSSTSSGVFTTLIALPSTATGYTHNNATAGTNCYRVVALSAQGDSGPSNVACKTNVRPVGPPNPPVLKTIDTVAYFAVPNNNTFAFDRGAKFGSVEIGAKCDASRKTSDGFYAISPRSQVKPRAPTGSAMVARCG